MPFNSSCSKVYIVSKFYEDEVERLKVQVMMKDVAVDVESGIRNTMARITKNV